MSNQKKSSLSKKQPTTKSDVYSFSIIAYRLITNKSPYPHEESIEKYKNKIIFNTRPNLSNINIEPLKQLLTKCWALKTEDRPTFSEIIEEMKTTRFIESMNVAKKDVDLYFSLNKSNQSIETKKQESESNLPLNSIEELKRSADNGNVQSMYNYAGKLEVGDGVSVNKTTAAFYFKMAADKEHVGAMVCYMKMLYKGEEIAVNKS